MKNLTLLLAMVLLVWIPSPCQVAASSQRKTAEGETTSQQRSRYQEEAEAKLRELNRKIDTLNSKANKQASEARKEFDRQMAELNQKREIVRQRLEKLKNSTQQAWRDMKPELDAAMKNLAAAYQRAAADFK